ncbi:MAG: 2'-5' RNA ligase family protein [Ferruginibacter sp.]
MRKNDKGFFSKRMQEKQNLYFIALIPDEELQHRINEFKQDFANRFNSSKALKIVSHITLKAPFKLPAAQHEGLTTWLRDIKIQTRQFNIELQNFGSFPNPQSPVVYVKPVNNASLITLQQNITGNFRERYPQLLQHTDLDFNPHITIAYRDLSPGNYAAAWQEYQSKEFRATFAITAFYLLQHDTRKWNIISERSLEEK